MVSYKALNTAIERIIANIGHAVGNGHRGQASATIERIRADAGHTVFYN